MKNGSESENLAHDLANLGIASECAGARERVQDSAADPRKNPVRTEMLSMYVFRDFTCSFSSSSSLLSA